MSPEITLLACIALPLLAPALITALHRWPNPREAVTLLTSGGLFLLVLSLHHLVLQGTRPAINIAEPIPGLKIGFEIEPLGMLFALLASFLWLDKAIEMMKSHDQEGGICRHHDEDTSTTISGAVYTCGNRKLYFSDGNPCDSLWYEFSLSNKKMGVTS